MEEINHFIVDTSKSLLDSMKIMDENARGILYVVDEAGALVGSVTDGDIRRWIIKTGDTSACVKDFMHKGTHYIFEGSNEESTLIMKEYMITSIPVLNKNHNIVDVIFEGKDQKLMLYKNSRLNETPVVIMAGGKGTRLYPYTKILPKPLIPIGDIPILERIMMKFEAFGKREFYISVNYKKEMIKSYFSENLERFSIRYIEEPVALGTAGSLKLINDNLTKPIIVTNCDSIIETDYSELVRYHKNSKNVMTIVSSIKNTIIQYGVLHTKEDGVVTEMEEKPHLTHLINTGMYVINPECIEYIPGNKMFHMTELAEKLIEDNKQVGVYPISENSFLDMGQFEEMKKMEDRINKERVL